MQSMLNAWLAAGSTKKVLLLRHGAIEIADEKKRFVGQTDLPLSDLGRQQAAYWRRCLTDVPLDRIVCSDLSRCEETARMIAAERLEVEPLAKLREIHLGQWDGLSFERVKGRWPEDFRQRGLDLAQFRPMDGESFSDLQRRVVPTFEKAVDGPGKTVLIVTHAGVIRVILCYILGMPLKRLFCIAQDYAAMNLIDCDANGHRIQMLNLPPVTHGATVA
jgi:alpha-ribazole phosphatase